jgi:hypothetical protein
VGGDGAKNLEAFQAEPRLAELERTLLGHGGHTVYLDQIIAGGRMLSASRVDREPCQPNNCHGNVAVLYALSKGITRIGTGYALSDDGVWVRHSWGVSARTGAVLETTSRFLRYYGFTFGDDSAAAKFFFINVRGCDVKPAALRKLVAFALSRLSPAEREQTREYGASLRERSHAPGCPAWLSLV